MPTTTYSTLFGKIYSTPEEAKAARDADYWAAKKEGKKARRSVLKGQLRQYYSYGEPCGLYCDCYELTLES